MDIESLIFEYRPNLSSINCFLLLCTEIKKRVKLTIDSNGILVMYRGESRYFDTKHMFTIKNESLFNFNVGNRFVSFGFLNERSSAEELLNPKIKRNKSSFSALSLVNNTNYKVTCSNCSSNLLIGKSASFHRILELPMQFEMEDMFCHLHSNEDDEVGEDQSLELINDKYCHNDHGSGESVAHKFQPNMTDIFYSRFYILMNNLLFNQESIKHDGQNAHCKRCLHLIGQVSSNQNSLKIWCENLHFNGQFFYETKSAIKLVIDAIERVIHSYHIVPSIPTVKIILECVVPKTNKKHNLLLQVMDRNLVVFQMKDKDQKILQTNAMKIMFCPCHKITPGKLERDELLKSWSKDLNVNCFEISFELFMKFYDYIDENSALIPHLHRTNGLFTFSYIKL